MAPECFCHGPENIVSPFRTRASPVRAGVDYVVPRRPITVEVHRYYLLVGSLRAEHPSWHLYHGSAVSGRVSVDLHISLLDLFQLPARTACRSFHAVLGMFPRSRQLLNDFSQLSPSYEDDRFRRRLHRHAPLLSGEFRIEFQSLRRWKIEGHPVDAEGIAPFSLLWLRHPALSDLPPSKTLAVPRRSCQVNAHGPSWLPLPTRIKEEQLGDAYCLPSRAPWRKQLGS